MRIEIAMPTVKLLNKFFELFQIEIYVLMRVRMIERAWFTPHIESKCY